MRRLTAVTILFALAMVACGTTDSQKDSKQESTKASTSGQENKTSGAISVTDSRDKKVELPSPATRVVSLEWGPTGDLLSLGVQPVAAADPKSYNSWGGTQPLPENTPDVGKRTEPSIDSLASAKPDLIIGVGRSIPADAMSQIEKIAPVFIVDPPSTKDPVAVMRKNFNSIATLVGKQAEAEKVLAAYDKKIAEAKAKVKAAGAEGKPLVFASINKNGNTVSIRMHGPGSLPIVVATSIGFTAGWTDPGDESWGLSQTDVEGLTKLPATTIFTNWANDSEGDKIKEMAGNPLWENLPMVKDKRVYPIANKVWVYGGPTAMMVFADQLVALVAQG